MVWCGVGVASTTCRLTKANNKCVSTPTLCLALCINTCPSIGFADGSRASVCGGSHGGFLTGHLMGQHPDRFKCAGLRNPVLNIALMVGLSDIPDWCDCVSVCVVKANVVLSGREFSLKAWCACGPSASVSLVCMQQVSIIFFFTETTLLCSLSLLSCRCYIETFGSEVSRLSCGRWFARRCCGPGLSLDCKPLCYAPPLPPKKRTFANPAHSHPPCAGGPKALQC